MTLKEIREQWEKDLKVISEFQPDDTYPTIMVVLKDSADKYHLHRYFCCYKMASKDPIWSVSVDCKNASAEHVLIILSDVLPAKHSLT